ncbi:hypothetical protein KTC96_22670 (plasmid) [Clostridium estertheticum]|uniref:hypothetical protein n=1 Tax=Clostridium estertheticum TaxID=238834 RepID=UPI001C7D6B86|nr:hypothetical protein [Clostridium estertheticum]MBX4260398.1 hypothetical protein [Clostridium estertheticum]WLC73020.1 hypothetical protein KTC96_22670 [Clostridium estertheticum]
MIKTSALIKQLNNSAKTLSLENKKTFHDITIYMRMSNIKTRDTEEFLQQMLDGFLNAEQQGVGIETMLGTSDLKQYCDEIIITYKSSYNYMSLCSEYIMDGGILIVVLSTLNYITQNFSMFISHGVNNLSFYLNFNPELIFQFLIAVPFAIAFMHYVKKDCFKKPSKLSNVKQFFIVWILGILLICMMVVFVLLAGKSILFKLNIIIVIFVGVFLYFVGHYLVEKQ